MAAPLMKNIFRGKNCPKTFFRILFILSSLLHKDPKLWGTLSYKIQITTLNLHLCCYCPTEMIAEHKIKNILASLHFRVSSVKVSQVETRWSLLLVIILQIFLPLGYMKFLERNVECLLFPTKISNCDIMSE